MLVRDKKKLIFTLVFLLAVSVSMEGVFAETEYKYPPAEEFDESATVDSLDNSLTDTYPIPYPEQEPVTAPAPKINTEVSQALPRTSNSMPPANPYARPMPQPGAYGRAKPPANPYARPMPQPGAYGRAMPPANPYARPMPQPGAYGRAMPPANAYARPMPQPGAYGRAMPPANAYARPMPQPGAYGRAMPPPGAYPPPGGSGAPGYFRPPPGGSGPGYARRAPNSGPGPYTSRGPNAGPGPYTSRAPNSGSGPYASRGPNGRQGSYGGPGPNRGSGSNMFPWGNQDWNIVDIMGDMPWVDSDGRVIPEFPWSREDNCHPKDKNCIKDTGPSSWIFDQGIKEDMAEVWDDVTSAPGDMGQMPGGWYVPSVYTPNPIDSGDQIEEGIEIIPDIIRLYE